MEKANFDCVWIISSAEWVAKMYREGRGWRVLRRSIPQSVFSALLCALVACFALYLMNKALETIYRGLFLIIKSSSTVLSPPIACAIPFCAAESGRFSRRRRQRRRRRRRRRLICIWVVCLLSLARNTTYSGSAHSLFKFGMRTCVVPWAFDIDLEINCIQPSNIEEAQHQGNGGECSEIYKRGIDGARDESSVIISLWERAVKFKLENSMRHPPNRMQFAYQVAHADFLPQSESAAPLSSMQVPLFFNEILILSAQNKKNAVYAKYYPANIFCIFEYTIGFQSII